MRGSSPRMRVGRLPAGTDALAEGFVPRSCRLPCGITGPGCKMRALAGEANDGMNARVSRSVLLLGSVPLESPIAVFEAVAAALGGLARRIPDGETGERRY